MENFKIADSIPFLDFTPMHAEIEEEMRAALLCDIQRHCAKCTYKRREISRWYMEVLAGNGEIVLPILHPDHSHPLNIYSICTKFRNQHQDFLAKHCNGAFLHYPIPIQLQLALRSLIIK